MLRNAFENNRPEVSKYVIDGAAKPTAIFVMSYLRFPPSVVRRRSPSLVYGADDRLPWGALLILAAQHGATAIAFLSYVLVATRAAGLDAAGTQSMLAMTLIGMAVCTALQSWGGRWGSGFLIAHMPNPFVISFVTTTLVAVGPGGMAMIALVYCGVTFCVAPLITRMRSLFPPAVVGTVIVMGGLTLVESAVRHSLGLNAQWQMDPVSSITAGCTLFTIVVASVWGGKRLGLMALLLGIAVGVLVSAVLGGHGDLGAIKNAALVDFPALVMPSFKGDVGVLVAVGLIAVLTQLDTLGGVSMMDKLEDADWRRLNPRAVSGGMRAYVLGGLLGLFGAFPSCISSTNIALAHATHATARRIGFAVAILLIIVAFMPKLTVSLMQIPEAVLGAVELYAAAFLIVAGFELVASRAMDSRSTFAVGLAISSGIAIMVMPQLMQSMPGYWRSLVGNAFVVCSLLVILLNMLFRLGTSRKVEIKLTSQERPVHEAVVNFVETQGAAWGARREVVQRAAMAALEGAEGIHAAGRQLTGMRGSFDEFNLDLELLHTGAALPMAAKAAKTTKALQAHDLLDADDEAFETALSQVSSQLLRHIADRVSTYDGQAGQPSALQLHFDH